MQGPSIKGIVIAAVAAHVLRLVDKGKITSEQLEAQLEKEDLELLETKIQPALWYSVYTYERLNQLMVDAEAGSDREGYLRRNGRIMAKMLRTAGLYPQLEGSKSGEGDSRNTPSLSEWEIKLTLSLWQAMVNFSRPTCRRESDDPPVFRIDVDEAEHYVPLLRVANAGFLEGVFSHLAGSPVRVEIDEDQLDHLVYRIRCESG